MNNMQVVRNFIHKLGNIDILKLLSIYIFQKCTEDYIYEGLF